MTFDETERSRWANGAQPYAETFAALCAHPAPDLLAAAGVGAGVHVLDAGTGTGTVAALATTAGARVAAIDAEPSMVAATAARLPSADVRLAVLPDVPFPAGDFDAVVANFVINHVGDPAAAVAALRDVTRPGGRIALTLWPQPSPPAQALWSTVFQQAGVPATGLPRVAAEHNFARTENGVADLLADAGLADIECGRIEWVHRTSAEAWWRGAAAGLSAPGQLLRRQPPEVQRALRASYDRVAETFRGADGLLALPTSALMASATVN
jgi:SAM-dependent methyltransferase